MQLHDFKVLTFDCYGTLIDWETGIFTALQPLLKRAAPGLGREAVLECYGRHEAAQEAATPAMIYSTLLAAVHRLIGRDNGDAFLRGPAGEVSRRGSRGRRDSRPTCRRDGRRRPAPPPGRRARRPRRPG